MNNEQRESLYGTLKELTAILVACGVDRLTIDTKTKQLDFLPADKFNEKLFNEFQEQTEAMFMDLTHGHYG